MQNYSTNVHFHESHTLFASQSLISRVTSFITTSGNMMTCCAIQTFSTSGIAIFSIKPSFAFYSEENIQSLNKLFLSIYIAISVQLYHFKLCINESVIYFTFLARHSFPTRFTPRITYTCLFITANTVCVTLLFTVDPKKVFITF